MISRDSTRLELTQLAEAYLVCEDGIRVGVRCCMFGVISQGFCRDVSSSSDDCASKDALEDGGLLGGGCLGIGIRGLRRIMPLVW